MNSEPVIVGASGKRFPPIEAQKNLREYSSELSYEWMPRAGRWRVMRKVPWGEVKRLIDEGNLTTEDVKAFLEDRYMEGHLDHGDGMSIHAFTVQGENGEYAEPGEFVIDALRRTDSHQDARTTRQIVRDNLAAAQAHEAKVFKDQEEAVAEAYELFDHRFRQLPRMNYPTNPLAKDAQN